MKEAGIQAPVIHILEEDGTLKKPVMDVLDIIAKYDMILATGHVSHEDAFALVKEAKNRGVKKIVVTHVDFPTTYYTVEEQKRFVEMGAVMEHLSLIHISRILIKKNRLYQIRNLQSRLLESINGQM